MLSQLAPPGAAAGGRLGENLSTVLACVNAISTAIASLPAEVQRRRADGGWETDDTHPFAAILRDGANDHQSWPDFAEWSLASTLLTGNGLAEVVRDRVGAVVALVPVLWGTVGLSRVPSGRIVFDISDSDTILGTSTRPRRLLEDEVLWLRDRTDDGIVGRSRLQRAAAVLQPAYDLQLFTGALWRNGVRPSGLLETEHKLTPDARKVLMAQLKELHGGASNAARALVLDQNLKWKQLTIAPEDAEVLETRKFTVTELARIYGVPPPVIGHLEDSNFANSESMQRWFAMTTLSPWISKLEHEVHRSVFSAADRRTHRLSLDLSGLLRGDPETRWQSHKVAIDSGVLTVNEIRALEGWPPLATPAAPPTGE